MADGRQREGRRQQEIELGPPHVPLSLRAANRRPGSVGWVTVVDHRYFLIVALVSARALDRHDGGEPHQNGDTQKDPIPRAHLVPP